eukprot:359983-Chlamydomonas_euryale.AAC.1
MDGGVRNGRVAVDGRKFRVQAGEKQGIPEMSKEFERRMSWREQEQDVMEGARTGCRGGSKNRMSWREQEQDVMEGARTGCHGGSKNRMSWRKQEQDVMEGARTGTREQETGLDKRGERGWMQTCRQEWLQEETWARNKREEEKRKDGVGKGRNAGRGEGGRLSQALCTNGERM